MAEEHDISITEEMQRSYLDYAMSVIVARALPDVCDGLKPVHRRILWAMHENGFTHDKPHRKSARIVGDVIGKYHPHGDQAVYDALVRLAQPFSMNLPLIDGQGNFGSIDGDAPAAMRYTEARMAAVAAFLSGDLDKGTVPFLPNYDNSESEPTLLPARFPNLLVNGAGGIAVGMATSIPPHNLGEIIDATKALIEDPAIADLDLLALVPGPDFPLGGVIVGRDGARAGLLRGHGSVVLRAEMELEEMPQGRLAWIARSVPFMINKALLVERIAHAVKSKKVEGIAELRDESNRLGVRVVMLLKRDAVAEVTLNQLYRHTQLQTNISVNMLALVGGRPLTLGLRAALQHFIDFRRRVVTARTEHDLLKARERAHILAGLGIAVTHIDEVVAIIRSAPDPGTAAQALRARDWNVRDMAPILALIDDPMQKLSANGTLRMTQEQARAILELRLQRLTALGRDDITDEIRMLAKRIAGYLEILSHAEKVDSIITDELDEVRSAYATPRRTRIIEGESLDDADLIALEDMVVTITAGGYVKRTSLDTYKVQRRGGKGRAAMRTKDEDVVTRMIVADTHTPLLFFTERGMVYKMPLWRLPEGSPANRGKALINILPLEQGERVTNVLALSREKADDQYLMFSTRSGRVRRNALSDFATINRGGKIAMKLDAASNDQIVGVAVCKPGQDVLLTTRHGFAVRFAVDAIRVFVGRSSQGVRGIGLGKNADNGADYVISMTILDGLDETAERLRAYLHPPGDSQTGQDDSLSDAARDALAAEEQFLFSVSENGFGKRTSAYAFRRTGRGGKGVIAMATSPRNGLLAAAFSVASSDDILLMTDKGKLIRTCADAVRIAGRNTQGVVMLRVDPGERVTSAECLPAPIRNGEDETT